jgi:pyruvate formate-lyase/glycerol dehydratase family glycyl radical enzyme
MSTAAGTAQREIRKGIIEEEQIKDRDLDRVRRLKDRFVTCTRYVSSERALLVTESYRETEGESIQIRRAMAAKKILENMGTAIYPDELIVGSQNELSPRSANLFPEFGVEYIEKEMDTWETRNQDPFVATDEVKEDLRRIIPYWKGKTLSDQLMKELPGDIVDQLQAEHPVVFGWCAQGNGIGHIHVNYKRLLEKGFDGIREEAEEKLRNLDYSNDPQVSEKNRFYRSIIIVSEAASEFGRRYARTAKELAAKEADPKRKTELLKIAEVCTRIPAKPARNFWEALQAVWFINLIVQLESNGVSISPGRMDQYLYPFYKKDLEEGVLTRAEALELLDTSYVKFAEMLILYDNYSARFLTNFVMGEHVALGGVDRFGRDATNELSYLMLQAQEDVGLIQPNMSVRWHESIPRDFMMKAIQVLKKQNAIPQFLNDGVYIDSLLDKGIPLEEARNYQPVGCDEMCLDDGQMGGLLLVPLGMAKCFELAMNDGRCQMCGRQLGPKTGSLEEFDSYEQLWDSFEKQVKFYLKIVSEIANVEALVHRDFNRSPVKSALMDTCMESGRDVNDGGARYYYTTSFPAGPSNTADSLAAVKKLVFEEGKIGKAELLEVLKRNFEGYDDIRKMLLETPKFGNDNDYVDSIMANIVDLFNAECRKYHDIRNDWNGKSELLRSFWPEYLTVTAHVAFGETVGAMPGGKLAKAPVNDGISPVQGMDKSGPTAAMNSMAKLDLRHASGGVIYNQQFDPSLVDDTHKMHMFIDLLETFFRKGGPQIQYNIVGTGMLEDAQKKPEKYKNLMVRVVGYAALFVELSRTVQDDIITRTRFQELS